MVGNTLGHFKIVDKLGEGGMGAVYKARDIHLGRLVAIKVLLPERVSDPDRRRRFVQEAKAASALNHPNIVTIYDIAQEDGADFIVMEFVQGKTLAQLIPAQGLPVPEALHYAHQIVEALMRAHVAGIIHRDLKPANIMVREDGLVKLLDFGVAKLIQTDGGADEAVTVTARMAAACTQLSDIVGTATYMSPEQAEGRDVDARSDIFSFGVVLYEMLGGRKAFGGATQLATLAAILHLEPQPLRETYPAIPVALERIVARSLRKERSGRFQSTSELKAALGKISSPEPDPEPSIAVLPFANLTADKENEYFIDGLAEDILSSLSNVPRLRVTARTSTVPFRGREQDIRMIGQLLNVQNLLEGSVRKLGNHIRVTVQLIKTSDGFHLWSERYDREMTDPLAVQDEISRAIVDTLKVKLGGVEIAAAHVAPTALAQAAGGSFEGRST
jgi:serine/threonine protein kinase